MHHKTWSQKLAIKRNYRCALQNIRSGKAYEAPLLTQAIK